MSGPSRRVVLDGVLDKATCDELIYLARCLNVIGYRAAVSSATCFEVAASEPAFLLPLMAARERVRAAVEEGLGLDLGLLVEFTGLISWRPGASIDFHHDANRYYLEQRHYSAVAYLNSAGADFGGGAFQFQRGTPSEVAYHAHDVHGVLPVCGFGERFTLTLWFTTSTEHDEDSKLLARLTGTYRHALGLPPSMYALPGGAADLRLCRLAMMGFALVPQQQQPCAPPQGSPGGATGGSSGSCSGNQGAEDPPPPPWQCVQVVVNLARLGAWRDGCGCGAGYRCGGRSSEVHRGGMEPHGSPAEAGCGQQNRQHAQQRGLAERGGIVLTGLEFPSAEQGVLVLQYWAWRWHPQRWAREEVCFRHLREDGAGGGAGEEADCGWVAALQKAGALPCGAEWEEARGVEALCEEMREAAAGLEGYLGGLRRQYGTVVEGWTQVGAVY